jgi:hypothetical protein
MSTRWGIAATNIDGSGHPHTRTSGCKDTPGGIFKCEAFVYLHVKLPGGGFAALRIRFSDGYILRCYQRRRRPSCARHHRALTVMDVSWRHP